MHKRTDKDKIDFVITWLDDTDPSWREERNKYRSRKNDDSDSDARYKDWGLLKYWFRAVEVNAPWVDRIYFVSCGQVPDWLAVDNPKIVVTNHEDYIPKEVLPTFNSNVIELFFGKISTLSEQFVYFNDDVFLNAPVEKEDFFVSGKPVDKLSFNAVSAKSKTRIIEHTILNNLELLSRDFNKKGVVKAQWSKIFNVKNGGGAVKSLLLVPWKYFTGIENHHSAQPLLKSSFNVVWEKYNDELSEFSKNRFRTKNDYSWWLVRYYQLFAGKFHAKSLKDRKYYEAASGFRAASEDILKKKHKIICINDSDEKYDFTSERKTIVDALERRYPKKSEYEK